jgi:cytochrome P450
MLRSKQEKHVQEDASRADTSKYFIPDHIPAELIHPFDVFTDPDMSRCPFERSHRLREHGRVFWNPINPLFRGSWVLTQAQDLRYVMCHPELFSNNGEAGFLTLKGEALELIPLELDPPRHTEFRRILNPLVSPTVVQGMSDGVTKRAVDLIEAVRAKGGCDFITSFGIPFPVSVFLQFMGLPEERMEEFLAWEMALVHTGATASENMTMEAAAIALGNYLQELADDRKANPKDDVVTHVVRAKINDVPLTDKEIIGTLYLLFLAGLDTVTATMGWFFHYLAEHPAEQQLLRENPERIKPAVEELMRRYSIVVSHRRCKADVEVAGVQMKQGDWITIFDTLGSTDPAAFKDPLSVDLNRRNISHFGFSTGPHLCMGIHLARRELETALREWLARIPMWRLKAGVEMKTHGGHTFGLDNLDLEWDV